MHKPINILEVVVSSGIEVEAVLSDMALGRLPWKFQNGHLITTRAAVKEWTFKRRTR